MGTYVKDQFFSENKTTIRKICIHLKIKKNDTHKYSPQNCAFWADEKAQEVEALAAKSEDLRALWEMTWLEANTRVSPRNVSFDIPVCSVAWMCPECTHKHMHMRTHVQTPTQTHAYAHTHANTHTNTCICTRTYKHTHICMCIHTYICTHILHS